jgi:hypothetical protein
LGKTFCFFGDQPKHKGTVLKNRYAPIIVVCGLLVLVIIGGLIVPAPSKELPVRLSMANQGGHIVFTHQKHEDYVKKMGKDCVDCHHESDDPGLTPVPCGSCHAVEFNPKFIAEHQSAIPEKYCVDCHHAELGKLVYDHDEHAEEYASDCTDCHHDTDIEEEPGACNQCHGEQAEGDTPSLRDAVHSKCESCHADMYEAKLEGCSECHEVLPGKGGSIQPSCNSCHYDTDDIPLLPRMEAFHDKCMNCHEEANKGPFGDESCKSCHTR